MPTFNVCVQIYTNKKKNTKFIKITNISLLFGRREIFVILINFVW